MGWSILELTTTKIFIRICTSSPNLGLLTIFTLQTYSFFVNSSLRFLSLLLPLVATFNVYDLHNWIWIFLCKTFKSNDFHLSFNLIQIEFLSSCSEKPRSDGQSNHKCLKLSEQEAKRETLLEASSSWSKGIQNFSK